MITKYKKVGSENGSMKLLLVLLCLVLLFFYLPLGIALILLLIGYIWFEDKYC
ncbi:MAG: hypothetical protein II073_05115 [Lachnospiraceae bacterium]|nr:hypothetical protein [Lachnospiraceae bacterium]